MLCKWALSTLSANGAFGKGEADGGRACACALPLCFMTMLGFLPLRSSSSFHPIQHREQCVCACVCGLLCPSSASNAFDMLISNSESRHRLSNNAELIGDNDDNMFGSLSSTSLNTLFNLGGPRQITHTGGIFSIITLIERQIETSSAA